MSNDKDAETPMERFEDFGRRLFRVTKEDLKKVEERAEDIVDDALGPPPASGPAIAVLGLGVLYVIFSRRSGFRSRTS